MSKEGRRDILVSKILAMDLKVLLGKRKYVDRAEDGVIFKGKDSTGCIYLAWLR
jgi:hypothetical protein